MGRGRQKAKHQKIARALKYQTSTVDLSALESELAGEHDDVTGISTAESDDSDGDDAHDAASGY